MTQPHRQDGDGLRDVLIKTRKWLDVQFNESRKRKEVSVRTDRIPGIKNSLKQQVKRCMHELGFLAIVAELNGDDDTRRAANRAWHQISDDRTQPEKR